MATGSRLSLRVARWSGWTLIVAGLHILLYLFYLLIFTNFETNAAQDELLEAWTLEAGDIDAALPVLPGEGTGEDESVNDVEPVDAGDGYAVMWFERPGSDEPLIHDGPLVIVEGVTLAHLQSGPGHYPRTDRPGGDGNFAISGHRTTYASPFYHLDQAEPGDLVHVIDRNNKQWTYEITQQRVVGPGDVWVIGRDPLGDGKPLMTITTCHPRFSAAQRLVVWAELRT